MCGHDKINTWQVSTRYTVCYWCDARCYKVASKDGNYMTCGTRYKLVGDWMTRDEWLKEEKKLGITYNH